MDKKQAGDIIRALCSYYPTSAPKNERCVIDMVNLWYAIIAPYDADVINAAVLSYVATDTKGFMPTPGQILAMIKKVGGDDLNEMTAWDMVSKALRNGIYASEYEFAKLPEIVQKAVGSPNQLCVLASDPEYNESVVMSNFQRSFRTEKQRAEQMALIPAHIKELLVETAGAVGIEAK